MKKIIISGLIILSYFIVFEFNAFSQYSVNKTITKKIWVTEPIFEIPESVIYNKKDSIIYVSNVAGSPMDKDGNGFISKLGLDGQIIKLKWLEGLNAPKGMCIWQDKLFVADIDEIVEISIMEGKILHKYRSSKALFLNDLAVDTLGNIYASDNMANLIFCLKDEVIDIWLGSDKLNLPNGLYAENNRLLIGNNGFMLSVDYNTKHVTRYIEDTDFIDGLQYYKDEYYIISDFSGAIYIASPSEEKIKIIDTTSEEVKAADIDFIKDKSIILVPTFYDNRIIAYKLLY